MSAPIAVVRAVWREPEVKYQRRQQHVEGREQAACRRRGVG